MAVDYAIGDPQRRKPLPGEPGADPLAPPPAATSIAPPTEMDPQQAATAGLGWVDKNHPLYGTAGFVGSQTPPPVAPPPGGPGTGVPGVTGDPQLPIAPPAAAPVPGPAETTTTAPAPYKDALLKMLGDAQTPASLNDPALKAQSDAANIGLTRGSEAERAQSAERLAAQGLSSSGAADADYGGIAQRQGEQQAGINAGLVGDANKSKLSQLQAALGQMGGDINSAEGRGLQQRIAEMQAQIQRDSLKQSGSQFDRQLAQQGSQFGTDADLRRLGITTQGDLGLKDLSLRDKLGSAGINANLLGMLMNNDQFGKSLSSQNAQFGAGLNQQALLQILAGL